MRSGVIHSNTCKAARGSGARGVEWADVDDKYRLLVPQSGLSSSRVDASLAVVHRFEQVKAMGELTGLLRLGV
jgi:hypothetical protein